MFPGLSCLVAVCRISAAQRESSEFMSVWGSIDLITLNTPPDAFVLRLPYSPSSLLQERMRTTDVLIIYLHVASSQMLGFQRIY